MGDAVISFIRNLCNGNNFQIELLRHNLKNIILRRNDGEAAIYFLGPGLTGKSTWANFLQFVMGELSLVWDAARLATKFDAHNLIGRFLLTLPDIDPKGLTPRRATALKNITSGEAIPVEKKHSTAGNYVFFGNVVMHGNNYFENFTGNDVDSTGISRRILLFPCKKVVERPNPKLPQILIDNCIPIIRWSLSSTLRGGFLLGRIEAINKVLEG